MRLRHFVIVPVAFLLAGCTAASQQPTVMQPIPQPVAFQEPPPAYSNPGSIFDDNNAQFLFADSRARRVGDLVMVNIVDTATGSGTANTNTKRDNSTEIGVQSFLGKTGIPLFGGLKATVGEDPMIKASRESEFKGSGTTSRRHAVTATVAARVINVLPDGLMQIEGMRETKVNNETQYLAISGLIRSRDVSADNSIMSTQMADAKIAYLGKGVISDKQKPGWLTRLLDNIWPL